MIEWPRLLAFASGCPDATFALVTLVRREGSSYRLPGARLLVTSQGEHAGLVSGGCLEDDLARVALGVLADGVPVLRMVDTRPHFGCHGRLTFFIEPLPPGLLEAIGARLRERKSFCLRTCYRAAAVAALGTTLEPIAWAEVGADSNEDNETNAIAGGGPEAVFVETVGLRPRLLVVGGSADAEPVLQMGELLGWEIRRILPAGEAGNADLPANALGAPRVCPAAELPVCFPPDGRTAVLIMTHQLARDTHYLRHVLTEPYGYIGLLGSRRRRDAALAALGDEGLLADEAVADRLHAPVGLDLGATDPAAVALSIVAEIQAFWSGRPATPLRSRRAPIHDAPRVALSPGLSRP